MVGAGPDPSRVVAVHAADRVCAGYLVSTGVVVTALAPVQTSTTVTVQATAGTQSARVVWSDPHLGVAVLQEPTGKGSALDEVAPVGWWTTRPESLDVMLLAQSFDDSSTAPGHPRLVEAAGRLEDDPRGAKVVLDHLPKVRNLDVFVGALAWVENQVVGVVTSADELELRLAPAELLTTEPKFVLTVGQAAPVQEPTPEPPPPPPAAPVDETPSGPRPSLLPGASADTIPTTGVGEADRLDTAAEVNMLVSVLLARDTPMPLAVGLFGDWGSGKSFFLAHMKERAATLADLSARGEPEGAPFCREMGVVLVTRLAGMMLSAIAVQQIINGVTQVIQGS